MRTKFSLASLPSKGPLERQTPTTSGLDLESATVIAPCRVALSFPDQTLIASICALYTAVALFLRVKMDSTFCIWLDTTTRMLFSASTRGQTYSRSCLGLDSFEFCKGSWTAFLSSSWNFCKLFCVTVLVLPNHFWFGATLARVPLEFQDWCTAGLTILPRLSLMGLPPLYIMSRLIVALSRKCESPFFRGRSAFRL